MTCLDQFPVETKRTGNVLLSAITAALSLAFFQRNMKLTIFKSVISRVSSNYFFNCVNRAINYFNPALTC